MKSIKNNFNPKKNPQTNALAYFLILAAFFTFITPKFLVLKEQIDWYYPVTMLGLGLIFLFCPDVFIDNTRKILSRKADTI